MWKMVGKDMFTEKCSNPLEIECLHWIATISLLAWIEKCSAKILQRNNESKLLDGTMAAKTF
jgi:hypothetical protein